MRSVFSVDESVGETVRLCEMLMSCATVQVEYTTTKKLSFFVYLNLLTGG